MTYENEKRVINAIVDYADKIQRESLNTFTVETKNGRDIVTNVDKQIEDFCLSLIRKHFPTDDIISEESLSDKPLPATGRYWVIDPLDGTWNFANGIPAFAIQVAFVVDNEVTLSAIDIPFGLLGREIYFAERNQGSFLNGTRIFAKTQTEITRTVIAVSDFSWGKNTTLNETAILNSLSTEIGRIRLWGSSAVAFAHLAAGRIGAYLGFNQKIWDILPGLLLAQEAGCILYGIDGKPYNLGDKNYIAVAKNTEIEKLLLELYKRK